MECVVMNIGDKIKLPTIAQMEKYAGVNNLYIALDTDCTLNGKFMATMVEDMVDDLGQEVEIIDLYNQDHHSVSFTDAVYILYKSTHERAIYVFDIAALNAKFQRKLRRKI